MENDPEHLKALLKENKGCIQPHEYEATLSLGPQ